MPLKFWNVGTGELIGGPPDVRGNVSNLFASPGGPFFASISAGEVTIWNSDTLQEHWRFKTKPDVGRLAFNSGGALLVGIAAQGDVFVWDVTERKPLASWVIKFGVSPDRIGPLFLPGVSEFLTSNGGDTIMRWEARTGKLLSQTPSGLLARASSAAISPDGRWLAASNNSWITIVDARSGLIRAAMSGHQTTALAFTSQGDKLISAGGPPFLVRWDINALPVLTGRGWSLEVTAKPPLAFASQKPLCLLSAGTQLGVWNYETQSPLIPLRTDSPPAAGASAAAFSSDGLRVAVLESGGRFSVWDVLSGSSTFSTRISDSVSTSPAPQLAFAEDGNVIWAAATAHLWRVDLQKNSVEPWLDWPAGTKVTSLSLRGRHAVASFSQERNTSGINRSNWQAWNITARRPLIPDDQASDSYRSFAFTQDETRLLALDDRGMLHHWNLETREIIDRFQIRRQDVAPYKLAFMPDQRHVVAFSHPNSKDAATLRVIDVESREEVLNFLGQTKRVVAELALGNPRIDNLLHVSHDGRFVITADRSEERLVFWNLYLQHNLGK